MAKTAQMSLIELMVLKQDINAVIEFIGKKGTFQFQNNSNGASQDSDEVEVDPVFEKNAEIYNQLKKACSFLELGDLNIDINQYKAPEESDREEAMQFLKAFLELQNRLSKAKEDNEKVTATLKEALSFSNLQVPYSDLDHLTFITLRIGKIVSSDYEELKNALENDAIIVPLGVDKSKVLIASSKKGRFALDSVLKNFSFTPIEIPEDFMGVPEDVLDGLKQKKSDADKVLEELETERKNFSETHLETLKKLMGTFTIGVQISEIEKTLESTELVYRITGWVLESDTELYMKELDNLTEGRIAFRQYSPFEVPSVLSGKEKIPVKLEHGKFIKSFERMIFSYGAPMYGTIDPTPFVAIFFTLLFGIMFGDLGQGLVFLLAGILMACKVIKVGGWNKFAPVFMAIGVSSSIMGLLTGEIFSNETLLEPFSEWVTGLFGTPHAPILKMMPSQDPNSIKVMFSVFGVAVAVGFVINTIGLIINIINNIITKKYAEAFFGKNGLAGALFFWYVVVMIVRILVFKHSIAFYDWIVIAITLFFSAFAAPFERALEHEKPLLENGFGTYIISGVVELIEVISGYLSNSVSFVRVGAFALSHAVLDFLVLTLTEMCGHIGGIFVMILGNVIIIVLEGMIVAIQVIRLQYYEFFSKFFHETGSEFKPFVFEYKN